MDIEIYETKLDGVCVLNRNINQDERGFLERIYCENLLSRFFLDNPIAQINHSYTKARGVIRGLHFQFPPFAELKVITCTRGKVFDVAVDLRKNSPTFLMWHAEELSEENHKSLVIPQGFAHGFQSLENDSELIYLHSRPYNKNAEGGINPFDPILDISWPLSAVNVSTKDGALGFIDKTFEGLLL